MNPEDIAQQGVMNLTGLIILTAIPVVAFMLWCDYFERFFKARIDEREEVNRPEELYRIRQAGFFISLFQILIFFGSTPIRREHPAIAYPLFLVAFLLQLASQRSIEKKIRGKETGEDQSFYWQAWRTFFWSLAAGVAYVSVILVSVFSFAVVAVTTNAPTPIKTALLLTGLAVGVMGGLSLNFALGAFFVRRIMNAKPIREGETFEQIKALFAKTEMPAPDFWEVDVAHFHLGSAMMAGFPEKTGLFRAGLFLSSDMLKTLTEDEVKAVVLHEISHWKLKHLKKRFTFSSGLILCASLITGMAVLMARFASAPEQTQGLIGSVALIASFVFAFQALGRQVRYQELAADIHSIEALGADLTHLASALRKLDRINDDLPGRRSPGSMLLSAGHPVTEFRIRVLQKYFEKKAAAVVATPSVSSEEPRKVA